ncbi:MAG: c-type cytochrome [Saprospiraceae bacterium]|nr:c-type cytochrome [Saprospiraceae bacterium]
MLKTVAPIFLGICICLIGGLSGCNSTSSEQTENKNKAGKDTYRTGELAVQHGMELFNQHCASCHNFSENGIGPNLAGVTMEVDKEWLLSFVANPPGIIESGDARAVALFEKYQQYMPPFPMIQEEDLEDIFGFIHKFSQGERRSKNNRPGGLINPIPDKIAFSNLTLMLEKKLVVPASAESAPKTRINKMEAIPGNRLFLHDLRGKLYEIKNDSSLSVYLDLAETLPNFTDNPGKGTGFGSWAFHPDFVNNGLFYTTHNEPTGTAPADFAVPDSVRVAVQAVVMEWNTVNPLSGTFAGTHRELLRVDMVSGAHGFQELTFNPLATPDTDDYGLLYLGIGDGAAALGGHPYLCNSNQYIWGTVIRIDPAGSNSVNGRYGIPKDNPFVDVPNALGEIWSTGFRNPHRISWDLNGSGKMFITNIGQHSLEEVNLGIAGADYGWPEREGTFLFDVDANPELVYPLPEDDGDFTYPVAQYDHDEGTAVSGGFAYAGTEVPELMGKYIFGDISRGTLFYSEVDEMINGQQAPVYKLKVSMNGELVDLEKITEGRRVDLRLGTDTEKELYILTKGNGFVYKVVGCEEIVL